MNIDFNYMLELAPYVIKHLGTTMGMTVSATIVALIIGLTVALIKVFQLKPFVYIADLYLSFFRGSPLIVQMFLIYYGLPQLFPSLVSMGPFTAAIISLSLHFGAYMAESMRGAIISVEKHQLEAAYSVGMTPWQAMRRIILPQASRGALPPLMNNFIDLLKSTSLAFTLGVVEVMASAQLEAASSFKYFESYLLVALVYWAVVVFFTRLQHRLEKN
ncbi:amino acid ABC transporter permease [Vibrio sp. SS-MA-C1-2]|nr:amino acid ABC transporter permease [Vibrio sp. SS-MA-C1-2]UJF18214.1 amino acid ABC transporter permease [Vibrio sp. SS-MA-C1-2]